MANELLLPGRGVVHAKAESTYGTDATPGASDVVLVLDFESAYQQDEISRENAIQPHVNGLMSVHAMGHVTWGCKCELDMATIANPVVAANSEPEAHWALVSCGFSQHTDDTDKTIAYALRDSTHGSSTIYAYEADQDDSIANLHKIVGARADFSLVLDPGAPMMLELKNGFGIAQALNSTAGQSVDNVIKETSSGDWTTAKTVTYPSRDIFLSHTATCQLIESDSGTVYGGGSVGSPSNALVVKSCTINGNMNPQETPVMSGNQGVARIDLRPTTHTVDLVLEATTLDHVNPYVWRAERTPLELNLTYTQPGGGNGSNTLQVAMFGQVVGNIDKGEGHGSTTWGLTLALRYPADAADSSVVGTKPANTIVDDTGGNAVGINLNPTSGYPATKLLLQFATA